jgi:hypothetical protein
MKDMLSVKGVSFNEIDMEIFSWAVVLDDFHFEQEQGHDIPFKFTKEQLVKMRKKVDEELPKRPYIVSALRQRRAMVQHVARSMVEAGVLSEDQARNPSYYRHQVLEYARSWTSPALRKAQKGKKISGKRIQTPEWSKRRGSHKAINLNLLEAEFEWMTKALIDVEVAGILEWVKNSDLNIHDSLIAKAKAANKAAVEKLLAGDEALEKDWKAFSQRIAIGLSGVAKALKSGIQVPEHLQAAANSITSGEETDPGADSIFPLLTWMSDNQTPGHEKARAVYGALNERRQWAKDLLGKDYAQTRDIEGLISRFEEASDVRTFQPDAGNMILFTQQTIAENAMEKVIDSVLDNPVGSTAEMKALLKEGAAAEVKNVLTIGGQKYQMVLPTAVALTMEKISRPVDVWLIEKLTMPLLRAWKKWVLINPRRIARYNFNNFSGDLDAVIAGNPRALRKMPQAMKELYDVMILKKEPSQAYIDAVRRGVFDSGLTVQEISQINEIEDFKSVVKAKGVISTDQIFRIWRGMQRYTWFRENWARYAAYLDYEERLAAGESMSSIGYGASVPKFVDAVEDHKDRAAKLARELVGDYGDISANGMEIRARLIPFYSWLEVNTKRYWRLSRNGWDQGVRRGVRTQGHVLGSIGVKAVVFGVGKTMMLYIRMAALFAATNMWNHYGPYSDDEDEHDEITKSRMHLNLGRDSDGNVRTLRYQGAFSDALDWFAWQDVAGLFGEIEKGRATFSDILWAIAKQPVNKVVGGLTPVLKVPMELFSGQSYFPDVFTPRRIRDRWRHAARMFTLEHEYDFIFRRPTRGYAQSLREAFINVRDPGEGAYNDTRSDAFKWNQKRTGSSGSGGGASTNRSRAMYSWRTAVRYGDDIAEANAKKRMDELGITGRDISAIRKRAHPLFGIPKKFRREYKDQLTSTEEERLERAIEWWREVFYD